MQQRLAKVGSQVEDLDANGRYSVNRANDTRHHRCCGPAARSATYVLPYVPCSRRLKAPETAGPVLPSAPTTSCATSRTRTIRGLGKNADIRPDDVRAILRMAA